MRTKNVLGNRIEQPEPMLSLAKEDHAGIRSDSMIGRLNLDGAIELGLKKVALASPLRLLLLNRLHLKSAPSSDYADLACAVIAVYRCYRGSRTNAE